MTSPEKLARPKLTPPGAHPVLMIASEYGGACMALGDLAYETPEYEEKFAEVNRLWESMATALRAEVTRLAQRQGEGDGWQPIETAPKDGRTLLLGYFNSHGKWRTLRGQWFSEAEIVDQWENDECPEGWYETSVECGDDVNCWKTEPTHFKFLPAAPGAPSQGVAVAQPDAEEYEKMRGGKPCVYWRDDALEQAAKIADAYRADPWIARDIRAMKKGLAAQGEA